MNPTYIEWSLNPDRTRGWTSNPITGCLNGCEYCYARRLANGRLSDRYLLNKNIAPIGTMIPGAAMSERALKDPFHPRFWPSRLEELRGLTKRDPRGVFVCNMSDLFGIGIPEDWTNKVLDAIEINKNDRFYLLTKQPQNLHKFSPFPNNCWVGVTVTDRDMFDKATHYLTEIVASKRYLSIEPLLSSAFYDEHPFWGGVDWVIIGACTGTLEEIKQLVYKYPQLTPMPLDKNMRKWTAQPSIEWVNEICFAANKAKIPVFLKNNLRPLFDECARLSSTRYYMFRQELPK